MEDQMLNPRFHMQLANSGHVHNHVYMDSGHINGTELAQLSSTLEDSHWVSPNEENIVQNHSTQNSGLVSALTILTWLCIIMVTLIMAFFIGVVILAFLHHA